MSASQRRKGAVAEREACAYLSEALGRVVQRDLSQTRDSGADAYIDTTAGRLAVEVKRQERANLYAWLEQVEGTADLSAVMWRPSRRDWVVCMSADDFVRLLREAL